MARKPDWWPAWLPECDADGHELAPGKVNLTPVFCDCEGAGEGRTHVTYRCRINGCSAEALWPPEHTGPKRDQR